MQCLGAAQRDERGGGFHLRIVRAHLADPCQRELWIQVVARS